MKRLLLGVACAAALSAVVQDVRAADPVKVIYANYVNPKHPTNKALEEFFKAVEEESKGSIDFEWHFGAALLGAKDIPSGVRDGIADSGYFVGVYVPSEMPVDNYIGDFTMLNDDPLAVTGALNEMALLDCPQCKDEMEGRFKTKHMGGYAITPYRFQCKKKWTSLADFKNAKVRGFSSISELVKGMGAVPVGVVTGEMYEALQRGVLDCATHMVASQQSLSLGEVANYVIMNSLGGFMGGSIFNVRLEKWAELSEEQRGILAKHMPKMITKAGFNYIELDKKVQKDMEAKGNEFYDADEDLAEFIKNFRKDYVANHAVEKGHERGVKNPEELKEKIISLKEKWAKVLDKEGRDAATFERLLWERVYSKMDLKG